eukprot:XP_011662059.1 PREDICTED: uncharacterized protein LOC585420 [Strongylocentrotus purpuratus]
MSRSRLASKSSKLGSFAKKHSVVSIYETFAILHPALQNEEAEKEHLSQLSNTLILALLPSDVIHCDSLVFLLQDILINNVLQPLVHLISDPDFLNEAFILILMDEPLGQYHRDADGKPSANAKQELTCTGTSEMEPESNCEEAARNHDDKLLRDSDIVNHDVDIISVNVESMEISENSNTTSQVEKTNSSGTQDTMDKIQNPSENEEEQRPHLDVSEGDKKSLPSPFEPTEPTQLFTFPMPMTMLEASMAIPRQDSDTVSKEDGLDEEKSEEVDLPSLETTRKVKTHRRSASTGSNIIAIQNPVSQSVGSVMDSVKDSMATDDAIQSSRFEGQGMRSCFSANCLTELGDCVPTSQETVSTLGSGTSCQSTSSLSSSNEVSSSSKINEQEEQDTVTDGDQMNAGKDVKVQLSSQGFSPSHRHPLIRSETAPQLLQTPPDTQDLHPSNGSEIPLEWATWRVTNLNIPTTSWLGDPKGKKPVVYFIVQYDLLKKPTLSDDSEAAYSSKNEMEVKRRYREFANLHARITKSSHLRRNMRGKYDLLKKPTLSDDSEAAYSSKNEMEVKRRYREFANLHARITKSSHLRRNMRGIVNIPKQSMLPISRLSPAMEEQKRASLETYLKQLLSRPVIHNSREMAEFLAIDGDGHIEFVKKATIGPLRIDKLLIHQVSGIVGTIKTILPERPAMMRPSSSSRQTPPSTATASAPSDQPSQTMQSHDQNGPMAEEIGQVVPRQQPVAGGEDQWDLGDKSRIRLFGLDEMKESHMQRVMKLLVSQKHEQFTLRTPSTPPPVEYDKVFLGPRSEGDGSDAPNEPHREGVEEVKLGHVESKDNVDVYEALFGVMSEALLNQQSFVLDESLQRTLAILIGDLVDRWLFREVGLLFDEAQWGYYLSLLRELLWPGGVWCPKERETKTPDEMAKTKEDALHELTHNAAAAVLSVILGEDHLREGISLVLDSLQDQALNKHLLFTFLDHAMDQLVTEIHDAKFQDLLAAMP